MKFELGGLIPRLPHIILGVVSLLDPYEWNAGTRGGVFASNDKDVVTAHVSI